MTIWTADDDARLEQMHADRVSWPEIANAFPGRSIALCQCALSRIRARRALGKVKGRVSPPWSEAETATLLARRDAGERFEEIGASTGRTPIACRQRYNVSKRAKGQPQRLRHHAGATKVRLLAAIQPAPKSSDLAPSDLAPSSLTAAFCGDPLPGRSALDRKRAGLVDEDCCDPRTAQRRPRVTLATGAER
jgi:hypothetical protein